MIHEGLIGNFINLDRRMVGNWLIKQAIRVKFELLMKMNDEE
jgi:hypothetical protein